MILIEMTNENQQAGRLLYGGNMTELLITRKRILLDDSPVLYDKALVPANFGDWEVFSAEWSCDEDGLVGRNPLAGPGCIVCRQPFPGNVLVDCVARVLPPSTHDIDVMWNMSWDMTTNERGVAYVAGVQGWWDGKIGIEKSPDYKLLATVPCPWFVADRDYHIQVGSVDGHCFVFVDGELKLELIDPDPIDSQVNNKVGFEAYQSMIRIKSVTVRQIVWEEREQAYVEEF